MKTALLALSRLATISLLCAQPLQAAVVFTVGNEEALEGGNVSVPVSVSGFANVSAFQFTLSWDSGVLTLQDPPIQVDASLSSGTSGYGTPTAGKLTFVWDTGGSLSLAPDTTIFTMEFTALGNAGASTALSFIDDPTSRLVTFDDLTEGTIGNGLMFTVNGSISVVPEPVNTALGAFAVVLIGVAGLRRLAGRNGSPLC